MTNGAYPVFIGTEAENEMLLDHLTTWQLEKGTVNNMNKMLRMPWTISLLYVCFFILLCYNDKGNRRRSIGYCPHLHDLWKSPLQPFQPAHEVPRDPDRFHRCGQCPMDLLQLPLVLICYMNSLKTIQTVIKLYRPHSFKIQLRGPKFCDALAQQIATKLGIVTLHFMV